MSQELTLEQWASALESLSNVADSAADISLVANPSEPLSPAIQEVISTAMQTVSESNGLSEDGPKAVVIATEAFSFENFSKYLKDGIAKIVAFLRKMAQRVLEFIKGVDNKVGEAVETFQTYDDNFWKKVEELLGAPEWTKQQNTGPAGPSMAVGVGDTQITSFDDFVKAVDEYVNVIPFQLKLLQRDADLINGLFGAVGHFGKFELQEGVSLLDKVINIHNKAASEQTIGKNTQMLGGVTIKMVSRSDNPGVDDNETVKLIQGIRVIDATRKTFSRVKFKLPDARNMREAVKHSEKVAKYFIEKKENFSKFSEEMTAKADALAKALESMKETNKDDEAAMASIMLGQKTVAALMWVISHYVRMGTVFFTAGRDNVTEVDHYFKELVKLLKMSEPKKPEDKTKAKP